MGASDFDLPPGLEALVREVCRAQGVASREQDAIRTLVSSPPDTWVACCGAACRPCVEDQKSVAREILERWSAGRR